MHEKASSVKYVVFILQLWKPLQKKYSVCRIILSAKSVFIYKGLRYAMMNKNRFICEETMPSYVKAHIYKENLSV